MLSEGEKQIGNNDHLDADFHDADVDGLAPDVADMLFVAVLAGKTLHSNRAVEDVVVLAVVVDDDVADAVVLAAAVDGFVAEAVDDIVLVDDGFVADAVADIVVVVDKPLHKQVAPVAAAADAVVVVLVPLHTLEALRCKKHRYTTQIR